MCWVVYCSQVFVQYKLFLHTSACLQLLYQHIHQSSSATPTSAAHPQGCAQVKSKSTTRARYVSQSTERRIWRSTKTIRMACRRETRTVSTCTHSYSWLCAIAPNGEEFITWERGRAHPVLFLLPSSARRNQLKSACASLHHTAVPDSERDACKEIILAHLYVAALKHRK